jgi:hypothetical protein
MKVAVVGGNQEVINKLNELGLEDLEIVNDGADINLTEEYQQILMKTEGVEGANKVLAEVFMAQNASKFFKLDSLRANPMKMTPHKINQIKKRRAKNKMARKSRKVNYARAKAGRPH